MTGEQCLHACVHTCGLLECVLAYYVCDIQFMHVLSVFPRNNFRHDVHTYIITYVCVHTMHHKLLAVSVFSTSMICTKHRSSIIYGFMYAFSYKYY